MLSSFKLNVAYSETISLILSSFLNDPQLSYEKKFVSISTSDYECVMQPQLIEAAFKAFYPGSGTKMTWKLIEASTGFVTGDDFHLNTQTHVISIKTHYPHIEGNAGLLDRDKVHRAILLIRNPLHSIPSYFNFLA